MNSDTITAITNLATRLDEDRVAANAIEETAPQFGVYGYISIALQRALELLVDGDKDRANRLYEVIIADGNTVAEALAIEAGEHAARDAELKTAGGRIRKALAALAQHGVTETQVQDRSGISDERWEELTTTEAETIPRISSYELASLADALVMDPAYLLSGDRTYSLKYSPCTLTAVIAGRYPAAG
jgi:hypothetical protein